MLYRYNNNITTPGHAHHGPIHTPVGDQAHHTTVGSPHGSEPPHSPRDATPPPHNMDGRDSDSDSEEDPTDICVPGPSPMEYADTLQSIWSHTIPAAWGCDKDYMAIYDVYACMMLIMCLVFAHTGYTAREHACLGQAYHAALMAGAWKNKRIQARLYIKYMADHMADPMYPDVYDLCSYVVYLAARLKAPTSVANYVSGAASWVQMVG